MGGEEFAILLPGVSPDRGLFVAEKLRSRVEGLAVDVGTDAPLGCTVSIGVSELLGRDNGPESALSRADAALYRAKAQGRNRVVLADNELEHSG